MFTSDTFLNVKQSCILVIRVVFKVQLKDLMTANTKNICKYSYIIVVFVEILVLICAYFLFDNNVTIKKITLIFLMQIII